jgi:TolB-like protein/DNA-binding winged helix-turn-helix (wHTH) protein/Flp pilus assembly protein TadD
MGTNAGRNHADISTNPRKPGSICRFLGFTLDTRRQQLVHGDEPVRLRPRTYDVLAVLATHAGRLVSKQEMMDAVWGDVAVTDDSLVQCLMEIRRALGAAQETVKTVRGRGYVLDTVVDWSDDVTGRSDESGPPFPGTAEPAHPSDDSTSRSRPPWIRRSTVIAVGLLVIGFGLLAWRVRIRQVPRPAPGPTIRSLAVLPFANLSRDPEQDYFADGITDDLITQFAKISALRVISRSSVMRFKATQKPLAQIARELDVDAVVEGTVVRSADRVRVTAQVFLVDPERNVWADEYDRPRGDLVTLQGALTREIAEAIRVKLTAQERSRLTKVRIVDPDAHEALLKGRYYWSKRTEEGSRKAIGFFEQAIARDPNDAMAFVGLSDSYLSLALSEALQEAVPPNEAFPKARAAAQRALELDDTLGEAHVSLGHVKFQYDRDWRGAELEFKRAIELSPNYAYAHHLYALCLMWMGRMDEALVEIGRAHQLDPLFLAIGSNYGFILARAHQYDRAIEECRKTLELDPTFAHGYYRLGQIYVLTGKYDDAILALTQAVTLSQGSPRATAELGLAYALQGNAREARRLIDTLTQRSKERYVSPFDFAVIYGGLGDRERTLAWLEKAEHDRSPSLNFLILSPAFTTIRSDPRFTALVRHIGLGPSDAMTSR